MDFYDKKKKAYSEIKQLIVKQKENYKDTVFYISEKYGFGEKIILKYVELLIERGLVKPSFLNKNGIDVKKLRVKK